MQLEIASSPVRTPTRISGEEDYVLTVSALTAPEAVRDYQLRVQLVHNVSYGQAALLAATLWSLHKLVGALAHPHLLERLADVGLDCRDVDEVVVQKSSHFHSPG